MWEFTPGGGEDRVLGVGFPKGVLGLRRGKEMEIEAQKLPLTPEI